MASNSTSPFGIEFGHVDNLQGAPSALDRGRGPRLVTEERTKGAFAALAARGPLRVAILSDFTRIPYANGAVFQTRFLHQALRRGGHEVTVIGPEDPDASPDELAPKTVSLPSVPIKAYPGLRLPVPLAPWIFNPKRWDFDVCFAQTTSMLLEFGIWLRETKGVPLLCVNTTHLPAAYEALLSERLSKNESLQACLFALRRPYENLFSNMYNRSDGLIVLSEGLRDYWLDRGVTVPIYVIPRAIDAGVFDRAIGQDPYTHLQSVGLSQRGARLLCAGRHTREKSQDRIIRIFARHVLPCEPDATLTLIGDGPETESYRRLARDLGAGDRIFFTGEVPWTAMPDFYRYADLFVHASLSETYGNVLGEALWCGTPAIAFADGMGVTSQIVDGKNGVLFSPGRGRASESSSDASFGRAAVDLVRDPKARARLGRAAAKLSRERCSPPAIQTRLAETFERAREHAALWGPPVAERTATSRFWTTLRCALPWTAYNGLIYLGGRLRPWKGKRRLCVHPSLADGEPGQG